MTHSFIEAEKEKYQDTTIRHQEEPDDSITIINSNKNTIVTGIATSGKSLLLKRIGVNAVNIYKRIGVFWFRFRELSLNQFNIDQLIAEQFRSLANTEIKDEYFDRYILLFDGLDEVKSKKDRIVFIEKINQYLHINLILIQLYQVEILIYLMIIYLMGMSILNCFLLILVKRSSW